MQQQQIKAENTVQGSGLTRSYHKNIALSFVNTGCTSNSYVRPHLSPPYCNQTTKVLFITLESKHNRQQKQAAMRNFKNTKCNDGEDIGKVNVLKFNLEHIEKIHIFARCNPYLHA